MLIYNVFFLCFHCENFYYFLAVFGRLIPHALVNAIILVQKLWCSVGATRNFALSPLRRCESAKLRRRRKSLTDKMRWRNAKILRRKCEGEGEEAIVLS